MNRISMLVSVMLIAVAFLCLEIVAPGSAFSAEDVPRAVIVCESNAMFQETLAAREIRRYIYLRTGTVLPVDSAAVIPSDVDSIIVSNKDRTIVGDLGWDAGLDDAIAALGPQQ